MRLHVENLGKIRSADLEIRPLTIFVGPNNTNKTWTAYALYELLMHAAKLPFGRTVRTVKIESPVIERRIEQHCDAVINGYEQMESAGANELRMEFPRSAVSQGVEGQLASVIDGDGLARLLAVPRELCATSLVRMQLEDSDLMHSASVLERASVTVDRANSFLKVVLHAQGKERTTSLWPFDGLPEDPGKGAADSIRSGVRTGLYQLASTVINSIELFPSARQAILSLPQAFQRETALEGAPLPVLDFALLMGSLSRDKRRLNRQDTPSYRIADLLEAHILEGSCSFGDITNGAIGIGPVRVQFNTHGIDLGIEAASSMVGALASLDIFLRKRCEPNSVIVIDEPEMNAHPEAQIKLAEVFAMLVNAGVRVVITTHSPYILDQINNLMAAFDLEESDRDKVIGRFKLKDKRAFLSKDKVAAYLFNESGVVSDILDRTEGIADLGTFGDPSSELANTYARIMDRKYANPMVEN